ncbi:hypothetical protein CXG81DRAFT_9871 [Caulochytrium protostelioides]|uniref:Uncharacterized protein n=1 Tax=Caulochytrium protostelioides TaxID=1555241 RepID=A0A4P9XCJ3_9FUNG|nr:hypothetical protein CXG81DRAFT_9871 [Caulochytrium protostelioides]|eukprot:RKP03174.1 hypothetical protein CXG81DRAFT_9871 [Caulochytrium protostelioides]
MPSYFPLKLRKCADPADDFFACFEGKAMPNGDPEVARRALAQCQETLRAYKDCMQSFVGPSAPQA